MKRFLLLVLCLPALFSSHEKKSNMFWGNCEDISSFVAVFGNNLIYNQFLELLYPIEYE